MQEPVVDSRYFPLVVNVLPERLAIEHLPAFLAKTDELLRRREPYVTVSDVSAMRELPSPVVRKSLADWSKENDALMRQFAAGTAVVIDSALIRGGLTALFWLAPPPYPQQVVATRLEAVDVVQKFYEAKGKRAPAVFAEYRTELAVLARRSAR